MNLYFLSANVPFAKTISPNEITPYPFIKNVSSYQKEAKTIEEFYTQLTHHAALGHCILKGQLNTPLCDEPRAGATENSTLTEWIVFDTDYTGVESAEEFISYLPKNFSTTSYIEQISATAFIDDRGYKAHLFFLLNTPTPPIKIKNFIYHLNLTAFETQITLGTGNLCLNYPLDINVNNNSTPLYIATPNFIDIKDPVKNRIKLITKKHEKAFVPEVNLAVLQQAQKAKLQELRKEIGLRGKNPQIVSHGNIDLLNNIEPMNTPPIKEERGFVYVQLNPNNPYSYYHPADNARIIYNFKGEPAFLTKKGLPDYWKTIKDRTNKIDPDIQENTPVIFRDRKQDLYFNGFKTKTGWDLSPVKNKQRLNDFATQNHLDVDDYVQDWEIIFDPTNLDEFDASLKTINLYTPPPLLLHCLNSAPQPKTIPTWTDLIIRSITGSDETCYNHFLNWLAYIFQTRKKTSTAWVFQGVEGTGKGLFYHSILKPLFGHPYCQEKRIENVLDNFNGWLEQCLILFVDETGIRGKQKAEMAPDKLKNIISEPEQTIRKMHSNQYSIPNFTNLCFATNNTDALEIGRSDRRYNICPDQTNPIDIPTNIEDILREEITQFAEYLWTYPTNEKEARTALRNEAKEIMHEAGLNDFGLLARRLLKGDFNFFYSLYIDTIGTQPNHGIYRNIIQSWKTRTLEPPNRGETCYITKAELKEVYQCMSGKEISEIGFGRLAAKHKLPFIKKTLENTRPWILEITWQTGLDKFDLQ